jgi:hypothetical protein
VITILNSLPTIVRHPGDYVTRDGRRVTIREIKGEYDPTATAFRAKGSIWKMFRGKERPRDLNIWHVSGRNSPLEQSPADIVGLWSDVGINIHERTEALGLNVLTYTNQLTIATPEMSAQWIPRDCIGLDGQSAILFRLNENGRRDVPGATYDFDGWEPCCKGPYGMMHGGRYATFSGALAWLQTAHDIRNGKRDHF